MCGITGIWYFDPAHPVDPALIDAMNARLYHRGPDQAGSFCSGSVALAARRLAIVDGAGSAQPLTNEDGSLVLVANGEIYNYRQLRSQRHTYRTSGDLETILHRYEEEGSRCVRALRGMFAFALWDSRRCRLTLAVDRFGKKPLYYCYDRRRVVFASELKALRLVPDVPREVNFAALDEYLATGYIAAPRTIYRDVYKLPPGHCLTIEQDGRLADECYWTPEFAPPAAWDRRPVSELAAELRALLEDAVRLRLAADQAPGAFLSGGMDSGAVVALMTQFGGAPVKTFSLGFADTAYDESAYARLVAAQFRTEHHTAVVDEAALDLLPELIRQFDEPFADASMIPTYLVARLARGEVRTVLSGDGGDEVFGGYHQHLYAYRQQFFEARLPRPCRPAIRRAAGRLPRWLKGMPYLAALDQPPEHWLANGFFSARQRQQLYAHNLRQTLAPGLFEQQRQALFKRVAHLDQLAQVQYHDLTRYLPGDILVKVDRASMFTSLEVRCPLLDHTIFEFMARVPPKYRVSLWGGKRLLKRALGSLLPRAIQRRRKQGFSIPQSEWLRQPLRPLLDDLGASGLLSDLFERRYIRQLAAEHLAGGADHKDRLWALLCLDIWARDL